MKGEESLICLSSFQARITDPLTDVRAGPRGPQPRVLLSIVYQARIQVDCGVSMDCAK